MIIAIDGPAGAGKSTIAREVAKRLGFLYIDTGAMYRALTLGVLEAAVSLNNTAEIVRLSNSSDINLTQQPDATLKVFLGSRDVSAEIREPRISKVVSEIAKIKDVRRNMVELQRKFGRQGNCVLDGRDIGTVVFPEAEKKFYLDADFSERARRRYKELQQAGQKISQEDVAADVSHRDRIDSTRDVAPLKKAKDAIYIDTTKMSIEEVVNTVLKWIKP